MGGEVKKLTAADISALRRAFHDQDYDKNGEISREQLRELLRLHFGLDHDDMAEVDELMPQKQSEEDEDDINFEEFCQFQTTDLGLRFDVQFVRHMRRKWEDYLGLQVYLPFLALFIYFLLAGKGLGVSYYQAATLNDLVMGNEFELSDDLRFVKLYEDIATEDEFWQWVEGPLLGGFWGEGDGDDATGFAQYANMPIGAIKLNQIRVKPSTCGVGRKEFLKNGALPLDAPVGVRAPWGTGITGRERLTHFRSQCYADWSTGSQDTEGYIVQERNATSDPYDGAVATIRLNATWAGNCPVWGHECNPRERVQIRQRTHNYTLRSEFDEVGQAYVFRECSSTQPSPRVLNGSAALYLLGKAGTYFCGGHALIIPFSWTRSQFKSAVALLKAGIKVANWTDLRTNQPAAERSLKWIDAQTRALSVEFFTFNQNLQTFSRLQYLVEVTAGGAWVPVFQTMNFRLFSFAANDFAYNFLMFIFFLYILAYFVSWGRALWTDSSQYLTDNREKGFLARMQALLAVFTKTFWTVFDFINYLLFLVVWSLRFVWMGYGVTSTSILITDWYPDEYETMAQSSYVLMMLDSINGLLCVFKVFYFLQLNPQFNILTKTIAEASGELVGLLFIFVVMFIGFCLMGYVVFGHVLEDYRDMPTAIGTLLRYLVGDFDYDELRAQRRLFAPVYFAFFQVVAFFLLLNMVIAVLSDAFASVSESKWKDTDLIVKLLAESPADCFKPRKGQTTNFLTDKALFREIAYWSRELVLFVQGKVPAPWLFEGSQMTESQWAEHMARQRKLNRNRNPRLYWAAKEDEMVKQRRCMTFEDKLNLCPLSLEEYLRDGDGAEDEEVVFDGFGNDFDKMFELLVEKPAESMELNVPDLLLSLLERHHYWHLEMSEVAEFMSALEFETQARAKQEAVDNMLQAEMHKHYGDEDEEDGDEGGDDGEMDEEEEAEEKEKQIVVDAKARLTEALDLAGTLQERANVVADSSNRGEIGLAIEDAVARALHTRTERRQVIDRFESGSILRGLRIHTDDDGRLAGLKRARFGRYIKPDVYLHLVKGFQVDDEVLVRDREWVRDADGERVWKYAKVVRTVPYFQMGDLQECCGLTGLYGREDIDVVSPPAPGGKRPESISDALGVELRGAVVTAVREGGPASSAGVTPPAVLVGVNGRSVWVDGDYSEVDAQTALVSATQDGIVSATVAVLDPRLGAGVYCAVADWKEKDEELPDYLSGHRFDHVRRVPEDEDELISLNIDEEEEAWRDVKDSLDREKVLQRFHDEEKDRVWRARTTDFAERWECGWYFAGTKHRNLFGTDDEGTPKLPNLYGAAVRMTMPPPETPVPPGETPSTDDPRVLDPETEAIWISVVPSDDVEAALHAASTNGVVGSRAQPFVVSEDNLLRQGLIRARDLEGSRVPWQHYDWADDEERHSAQTKGLGGDESLTCFAQLEIWYEPTTPFREHILEQVKDMIRKKLPNVLRQELTAEQIMLLLKTKVHTSGIGVMS
eukprot:TRINITY_DN5089_c2_g1_i4.p1 TRINITY_DN5089_c2_g1~~TRINITY_DN5089_c2_g1_i4.p1  ORF type:complete len:1496 (+),score=510.55 TRINITY_DN5089_c2_g1_i4:117-4604(+)